MKTLHGKLAAVLLGLLCLTSLLYLTLTVFTTRLYLQEADQKLNRRLASDLTAHLAAHDLLRPDATTHARAISEIGELMAINPSVEVYLLDSRGKILAHSAPPSEVKRQQVSLTPLRRLLSADTPLPILGTTHATFTGKKFSPPPLFLTVEKRAMCMSFWAARTTTRPLIFSRAASSCGLVW